MNLVRQILLELEIHPYVPGYQIELHIDGYSPEIVSYHVMIMQEAGLIEASPETHSTGKPPIWSPSRLTWQGHEFLDAARDNSRWDKAMDTIRDKASAIPFGLIQQLLIKYAATSLELD